MVLKYLLPWLEQRSCSSPTPPFRGRSQWKTKEIFTVEGFPCWLHQQQDPACPRKYLLLAVCSQLLSTEQIGWNVEDRNIRQLCLNIGLRRPESSSESSNTLRSISECRKVVMICETSDLGRFLFLHSFIATNSLPLKEELNGFGQHFLLYANNCL